VRTVRKSNTQGSILIPLIRQFTNVNYRLKCNLHTCISIFNTNKVTTRVYVNKVK